MKLSLRHKNGFTIVELLIVVAVIAILAAVAVVGYYGVQSNARDKSLLSDIEKVEAELTRYATKNGGVYGAILNWDSSVGSNSNIRFEPSPGNILVVASVDRGYCVRAYNPSSNKRTLTDSYQSGPLCLTAWTTVSAGVSTTCGIATNGYAYCWGVNTEGQRGDGGVATGVSVPTPVDRSGVLNSIELKDIRVGQFHACALSAQGRVYCWGSNTSGQLGNQTFTSSTVPVEVYMGGVLSGKTVKELRVGATHSCVIASDNWLYCWGSNAYNQLANGSTTNSNQPVAATVSASMTNKTVRQLSAGTYHTCIIASDATPNCAGNGTAMGWNSGVNRTVLGPPTLTGVLASKTLVAIGSSGMNTCAVDSAGLGYCWGAGGASGALGYGGSTSNLNPVALDVTGALSGKQLANISAGGVTSGNVHFCAIDIVGAGFCWGNNTQAQLGTGNTTATNSPLAINQTSNSLTGKTLASVVTGERYTCAVANDRQAYCWGIGTSGQIGTAMTSSTSPRMVTLPVSF